MTEAGSLFQYFTTLIENADHLLRRLPAPWSTLKGSPLRPRRAGGRKNKFGSISKRPSRCRLSSQGRLRMPVTNRATNCPFLSPLFLPTVGFREEQNFRNPGMYRVSNFAIKRRSANHSRWPNSKAARKNVAHMLPSYLCDGISANHSSTVNLFLSFNFT